jgi:hypothetical protein
MILCCHPHFFLSPTRSVARVSLKRQPVQPKVAYVVKKTGEPETIQAAPYIDLV